MTHPFQLFVSGLWPPSTHRWAWFFVLLFTLTGLLSLWRRGRVLLVASVVIGLSGIVVVLLRTEIWSFAALGWMTVAASVLGKFVLRCAGPPPAELKPAERIGFVLLLGFGGLSLLAAALAWIGILKRGVVAGLLGALAAAALTSRRNLPPAVKRWTDWASSQWGEANLQGTALCLACLGVCFAFPFLWAVAPSVHWDALAVHLPVAAAFISEAGFPSVSHLWYSYLSGQPQLLYSMALALAGQPLPALLHFSFALILTVLVFSLADHLAGRTSAWLAAVAFASMPMVSWEAGTAYIDLFVTAYVFGSIYALIRWQESHRDGWVLMAGILGGMGVGTKLSAGLYLVAPAVYVCLSTLQLKPVRNIAQALLAFHLPLILLPLPWLLRNWLWTGNPVYPFLGTFFKNPETDYLKFNWPLFGVGRGVLYFLRLPYDFVAHGKAFDETGVFAFGLVPLAALASLFPVVGKQPRAACRLMWGFAVSGSALWFAVAQISRYLLPVLPMLAVLAALPLARVCDFLARHFQASFGVVGFLGLFYVSYTRGVHTLWNYNLAEGYPYRYALGLEKAEHFLRRALRVYPAQQYVNAHRAANSRIFSPTSQIRFYSQAPLDDPVYTLHTARLGQLPKGRALAEEIQKMGYDYLLVDRRVLLAGQAGSPFADEDFLRSFTQLVFSAREVALYRVRGWQQSSSAAVDLATNGSFHVFGERHFPIAWESFGSPQIVRDARRCLSPPACVAVTQDDGLYQRVAAKPDAVYTVSLWARAEKPGQSVWLQVLWFDSRLRIIDTDIVSRPAEMAWRRYSASFSPIYREAAFVSFYARAARGSQVLIDDLSFALEK